MRHQGEPDVDQPGHGPAARVDQGHPPGRNVGRDAAEVDGDPRDPGDRRHRLAHGLQAPYPGGPQGWSEQDLLADRDGPGRERAGDDGAAPPDAERPVYPQPDRRGGIGGGQRRHQPCQRGPQFGQAGAGHRAYRHGFHDAQVRAGYAVERLTGRRTRVGQVRTGDREQAVPDADGVNGGQVLGGLWHPAAIRSHHDQHGRHRADAGQHVRHEPLVAGHVDEGQPFPAGQLHPGEPEVDCQPPAPFLSPPVRLHSGQRPDQRRLSVIHVSRSGYDLHETS